MNHCVFVLFLIAIITSVVTSSTVVFKNDMEEDGIIDSRILWSPDTCKELKKVHRTKRTRHGIQNRNLARRPVHRTSGRRKRTRPVRQGPMRHETSVRTAPVRTAPKSITELYANAIPDTFFGEGNSNGFFTCSHNQDIQVCIRFKQQFGTNGQQPVDPNGSWNNADGSFTVTGGNPCNSMKNNSMACAVPFRTWWSYDWTVNVDMTGTTGHVIGDYDIILAIDSDPSCETCWVNFFPFIPSLSVPVASLNHAFGDNTFQGDNGLTVTDVMNDSTLMTTTTTTTSLHEAFQFLMDNFPVAQNSINLGEQTFPGTGLEFSDPSREGAFMVALRVGKFMDPTQPPTTCNDNFQEIISVEVPFFVNLNQPLQDPFVA